MFQMSRWASLMTSSGRTAGPAEKLYMRSVDMVSLVLGCVGVRGDATGTKGARVGSGGRGLWGLVLLQGMICRGGRECRRSHTLGNRMHYRRKPPKHSSLVTRALQRVMARLRGYRVERASFEPGTAVWVGKPGSDCGEVVDALRRRLSRLPAVKAAYLAQVWTKGMGEETELAVAVDAAAPIDEVAEMCTRALAEEGVGRFSIIFVEASGPLRCAIVRATEPFHVGSSR